MSMTRERAAEWFETHMPTGRVKPVQKQAYLMALSALRPVSREWIEEAWRGGCEKCNGAGEYSRYAENLTKILLAKYCPHCGRPLTDEAVRMVMRRLEEMHETT